MLTIQANSLLVQEQNQYLDLQVIIKHLMLDSTPISTKTRPKT